MVKLIRRLVAGLLLGVTVATPGVRAESFDERFHQALELKRQGKKMEAFKACLGIPGAEFTAITLGKSQAADFLKEMGNPKAADEPMASVVMGDLLLAQGQKENAMACYQRASATLEAAAGDPQRPHLHAYYPVEPEVQDMYGRRDLPFRLGPGSHRDNLLLRRFIAADAWDDAAREFRRVWAMHQQRAEPYAIAMNMPHAGIIVGKDYRLFAPPGFDGLGLRFAIDYAFFLKQREKGDEARALLLDALQRIDMDRNPNLTNLSFGKRLSKEEAGAYRQPDVDSAMRVWMPFEGSSGISRKEFIRLVFGEYRNAGKEDELVASVEQHIAKGNPQAMRLLARIRLHQGRPDDALALEMQFIEQGKFTNATAAYRRGQACEDMQQHEQAVRHYESLMAMPADAGMSVLPDPDEEAMEDGQMRVGLPIRSPDAAAVRADVVKRLTRIRGSLGDTQGMMDGVLAELEGSNGDIRALEAASRRFEALGRGGEFADLMRKRLEAPKTPNHAASLCWMLGEKERCATLLAESVRDKEEGRRLLGGWEWYFRKEGAIGVFLRALQKVFPDDPTIRIELLEIDQRFSGANAIQALEQLLNGKAKVDFSRRHGEYHALKFRNYYDLSYRLMRLYEKAGRLDDLRALGMRMAGKQGPFDKEQKSESTHIDSNSFEEDVNACMALLVHHADAATMELLDKNWSGKEEHAGFSQLQRRQRGSFADAQQEPDMGWSDLPGEVRLLASTLTVLDMACDDTHVYAGHPWGVSVHQHDGTPVTRVALGEAVLAIAIGGGHVWAGTTHGLFRISIGGWKTGHIWLDGDVPASERKPRPKAGGLGECDRDNRVNALSVDGDDLWIAMGRNVQRLDMKTLALRAYSGDELKADDYRDYNRILVDSEYVWLNSRANLRRYSKQSDSWSEVMDAKDRVQLVGMVDGHLFGEVYLNNKLRSRPCLIDRHTLEIRPLMIEGDDGDKPRCNNGPYNIYGMHEGRIVFGEDSKMARYAYDEKAGKLVPLGDAGSYQEPEFESVVPSELRKSGVTWSQKVTREQLIGHGYAELPHGLVLRGRGWTWHIFSKGHGVIGRHGRVMEYHVTGRDWPYDSNMWHRVGGEDGIVPVSDARRLSSPFRHRFADAIDGNTVFTVVPDEASSRVWACTDFGVAMLDSNNRVAWIMTKADGLPANRIPSGAIVSGKPVFAAGWGWHAGGLVVVEPATKVLNTFYQSDGLASDKLARVEESEGLAKVSYDLERDPKTDDERVCKDSLFNILTGSHVSGGETSYDWKEWAERYKQKIGIFPPVCPFLGGFILNEVKHQGKTYACGTRGLVIFSTGNRPTLRIEELEPRMQVDPRVAQQEEALQTVKHIKVETDLRDFLKSENPYVRERAFNKGGHLIRKNLESFLPLIWELTKDSHAPIRYGAVRTLRYKDDQASVPHLLPLLKDVDEKIRDEAAIALARVGKRPDIGIFVEMCKRIHDSSRHTEIRQALARDADEDTFRLMLDYPENADDYEPRQKVFESLGAALRQRPECVQLLLNARSKNGEHGGPTSNYGAVRFAQEVFRYAGKPMLPMLHDALASEDRVVRSNAARGCGAIKDTSSTPLLIKALDLESGLSRASIVWALGELRATEALPSLELQYLDARNDEKRRRGSGYRASQEAQSIGSHYDSLRSVDRIQGEWQQLKEGETSERASPRETEWLLSIPIVLDAIRKIGPEHSQNFYRMLAGEQDSAGRRQAAETLAEGPELDREKNLPVLRNLLGDDDSSTRARASVSLLILREESIKPVILETLRDKEQCWETLEQLMRIKDPAVLAFADEDLKRLAKGTPPEVNASLKLRAQNILKQLASPVGP